MLGIIGKNIRHRPLRNGILILAFAFIAASIFSGQYLLHGASESIEIGVSRMGADLIVVPERYRMEAMNIILRGEPSTFFFDASVIDKVASVEGVERVAPNLYIASLDASCCDVPVQLIAIDPERDFTLKPWLAESQNRPLEKNDIIVGSRIVGDIGTPLQFYGHTFNIAQRMEPAGMGVDCSIFMNFDDAFIMADESPEKAVQALLLPEEKVSAVLVKVKDVKETETVAARIEASVPKVRVLTPSNLLNRISSQLTSTTNFLDLAAFFATLISLPLIALVSIMAANERRREIGVLRALGATRGIIFRLILGESVIIAVIGAVIGVVFSWCVLILFQNYISMVVQIPLIMPNLTTLAWAAGTTLALTIGIGGIAALYPAIHYSRMEPYDAMRSGDL
ncbi:MAG: ABC transporter permease [Methanoregula sp.]|nr:ABC transporter permease [Methanoregula sp.]